MKRRIETKRLILRTVTLDDADAIYLWASDPKVNRYMIYPLHKDIEVTRQWLKSRDIDGDDEFEHNTKGHCHPRASPAKTRGFHTQLDEGPETP